MVSAPLSPQTLREGVADALKGKKSLMLSSLAQVFGVTERDVAHVLPEDVCRFASKEAFERIWQVLATWKKSTFIMTHRGSVLEIKGMLPTGAFGHGYYNLTGDGPLRGHLNVGALEEICFLSLPFMGLESHSVQFLDGEGHVMFSVYVGREQRALIPAVLESFFALREAEGKAAA